MQARLYNCSVLHALKTQLKKSAFLQRSLLPTSNSFLMATIDLNHVQFWAPIQTHSFTSSALLYHRARAGLSAQTALETSQHCCTTKQIEYLNATTSLSLQLQQLGTKGMTLQLELKVVSRPIGLKLSLTCVIDILLSHSFVTQAVAFIASCLNSPLNLLSSTSG